MDLTYQKRNAVSRVEIYRLLQNCMKDKDLVAARRVHSLMINSGLNSMPFWGDHLIRLFASCGSLPEAKQAFYEVSNPNVYTWNAIISAHAHLGECQTAIELYNKMQHLGIKPDRVTFLCCLKACGNIRDREQGRQIHRHINRNGLESDVAVGSALVDMYMKCNCLIEAQNLFHELPNRNVVSWSSIIAGYTLHGHGVSALEYFEKMQQEGIEPSKVTFLCVLKACASIREIDQGRLIHVQVMVNGLEIDVAVGNTLVDMYAKCGSFMDAYNVFDELPVENVVSWTALIGGYAQDGDGFSALELFKQMQQEGIKPNRVSFLCALKACSSIGGVGQGRHIHNQILQSGIEVDVVMGSTLLDTYAKCGSLAEACSVFDRLQNRNVVSWDAMIAGYAEHGHGLSALELYEKMQSERVKPIRATFLSILKACGRLGATVHGFLSHDQIIRSGLGPDVTINNTLVDMYAKCGSLKDAERVFYKMAKRNAVSWTAMIAGYVQYGHADTALVYFEKMQQEGIMPDVATFSCILKAHGVLGAIEQGRSIHDQIIRCGVESNVIVGSSLIDMFIKFSCLEEARSVFDRLSDRNVVSWGAMISGYVHHGNALFAFELLREMQEEGVHPDKATLSCTLKVCGSIGATGMGMVIHVELIRSGFDLDAVTGSMLVDMYAKGGCVEEARNVFDALPQRDVVSWGAMIAGYAQCGDFKVAEHCLKELQQQGLKPVESMYTSIISGCSRAGLPLEGCHHFRIMKEDHAITPSIEQYSCMVDLLGRAGSLKEAEDVVQTMPISPDATVWTSLLTSCKTFGNIELGQRCFEEVHQLNPTDGSAYVLLSQIFPNTDLSELVTHEGKNTHAWVKPERTCTGPSSKTCAFIAGSKSEPQYAEVSSKLRMSSQPLEKESSVSHLDLVLRNISDSDDKEPLFCSHCERLALALGLVTLHNEASIRPKNLRICIHCHSAIKAISKIEMRAITIRDTYQTHCFKEGVCSCRDQQLIVRL